MPDQAVVNAINTAAARHGIDPSLMMAIADRESSFNPYANSGSRYSTAFGLFQLLRHERAQYGGNSTNPEEQAEAWANYIQPTRQEMAHVLGRDPSGPELYLGHYFGGSRAAHMLTRYDPQTPVETVFTPRELAANPNIGHAGTTGALTSSIMADIGRRQQKWGGTGDGQATASSSGGRPDFSGDAVPDFSGDAEPEEQWGRRADLGATKPMPQVAAPPTPPAQQPQVGQPMTAPPDAPNVDASAGAGDIRMKHRRHGGTIHHGPHASHGLGTRIPRGMQPAGFTGDAGAEAADRAAMGGGAQPPDGQPFGLSQGPQEPGPRLGNSAAHSRLQFRGCVTWQSTTTARVSTTSGTTTAVTAPTM